MSNSNFWSLIKKLLLSVRRWGVLLADGVILHLAHISLSVTRAAIIAYGSPWKELGSFPGGTVPPPLANILDWLVMAKAKDPLGFLVPPLVAMVICFSTCNNLSSLLIECI